MPSKPKNDTIQSSQTSQLQTPEQVFLQPVAVVERPYHYFLQRGFASDELLACTGLTEYDLDQPERYVARWQEFAFVRNLLQMGEAPQVAFEAGRCFLLGSFGVMGLGVATANTLWEGLVFLFNHVELSFTQFQVDVYADGGDRIAITFRPKLPLGELHDFFLLRDVACTVGMIRDLASSSPMSDVMELHLRTDKPAWHDAARQVLTMNSNPLSSQQRDAEIRLNRRALSSPLMLANRVQHKLLTQQCFTLLQQRRLQARHMQVKVWQLLATQIAVPSLHGIAQQLAVSPRTLRRKLAEEGTHFQGLVDLFRQSQARELLLGNGMSVEQVAERLGYSEASTFVHAFKRWTGKTPGQFRREIRSTH